MADEKTAALRPFHETIVDAIERVDDTRGLALLSLLIKETKIPKGHDEIIAAWRKQCGQLGDDDWHIDPEVSGVLAHLRAQKQAAEEKAASEKKSINLDELQRETEKLLALLNDRQPGFFITWHEFLHEQLQALHKLTSQALGK